MMIHKILLSFLLLLIAVPIPSFASSFQKVLRGGGNCLSQCLSKLKCGGASLDCANCIAPLDPICLIEIKHTSCERAFMLSSDIDDTMIGDRDALATFNKIWLEECVGRGCKLVYNTGRSLEDYLAVRKGWDLLVPDVLIGGCGSQVYTFDAKGYPVLDRNWMEKLKVGWSNKAAVIHAVERSERLSHKYGKITQKKESTGNDFMYSCKIIAGRDSGFSVEQTKKDFEEVMEEAGFHITVSVASVAYSTESTVTGIREGESYIFVDVLPAAAGKGAAQVYVRELLGFTEGEVVVAGDSGNDVSMFTVGCERGIMVGNARAELVAVKQPHHVHTQGRYAAGVVEGLENYGLLAKRHLVPHPPPYTAIGTGS